MRISDWSSDVCSSDLDSPAPEAARRARPASQAMAWLASASAPAWPLVWDRRQAPARRRTRPAGLVTLVRQQRPPQSRRLPTHWLPAESPSAPAHSSEEHTAELQSLMRNSYAVFCFNNKNKTEHE